MRLYATVLFIAFFIISTLFAADLPKSKSPTLCLDNISIDIDNGSLIIEPRTGDKFVVEITDKDELFVNGRKISSDDEEKELLKEYRQNMIYLVQSAKEIGFKGAKVGLHAIGGLIEVACTDLEMEELKAELEAESEKIESDAEELEELGSRLEDLHYKLKYRIPELKNLPSF